MGLGQWVLVSHDGREVYILRPWIEERRKGSIWRRPTHENSMCWS